MSFLSHTIVSAKTVTSDGNKDRSSLIYCCYIMRKKNKNKKYIYIYLMIFEMKIKNVNSLIGMQKQSIFKDFLLLCLMSRKKTR